MIPKIIHYCWFGGNPLPELAQKCIASWRKYLPDYEIKQWDESNFDVNIIPYTAEAYKQKKYAFVSDYARFWILYKYGGIYFDTDVEVIRPMDEIIAKGNFMGFEKDHKLGDAISVAPGLGLGVNPGLGLIQELLEYYQNLQFTFNPNGKDQVTIVGITTDILLKHGLKYVPGIQNVADVTIYPSEYFCPINITTKRLHITKNTCTIHHYAASWMDKSFSLKDMVRGFIPEWLLMKISYIKQILRRR